MNQSPVHQSQSKKPYQQPQLKTYGDLRRLTQSGSQTGKESGLGPNKVKA